MERRAARCSRRPMPRSSVVSSISGATRRRRSKHCACSMADPGAIARTSCWSKRAETMQQSRASPGSATRPKPSPGRIRAWAPLRPFASILPGKLSSRAAPTPAARGSRSAIDARRKRRRPMQLLIKNVRTSEHNEPIDIAIDGGRIAAIERGIGAAAQRIVDAGGRAAIPGLLEPHLHLEKALLHRRMPARSGTLEEAIRITGILKGKQEREDVLARSRQVLDMAVKAGTTAIRAQPDVDVIQGLIGVETALELREEYRNLLDLQIVAFPQEGILKSPGTVELMERALRLGADVVGGCPYNELTRVDTEKHIDIVFGLAQKYGVPVDLHADFADDASDSRFAVASFVARKTIETGYRGRVSLGHMTSLGALTAEEAKPVIDLLHEADIHIVT